MATKAFTYQFLAAGILAGICLGLFFSAWPTAEALLLLLLAAVLLFKRKCFFLAAVCFGYAWAFVFLAGQLAQAPSSQANLTKNLKVEILTSQAKPQGPSSLEVLSPSYGKLRLNWYVPKHQPLPQAGETWQLETSLRPLRSLQNFNQPDFNLSKLAQGQVAGGYVARNAQVKKLSAAKGLAAWKQSLIHQAASNQLNQELTSGWRYLFALSLGAKELLTSDDWQLLQTTGTLHLWVVSGLHLGLLAGLALWLMPKLGLAGPPAWLAAAALALGYAYLAGFGVAAQRASFMLLLGLLLLSGWRKLSPSLIFSLALLGVLLPNPLMVFSKGFWLSFTAVAILLIAFNGRKSTIKSKPVSALVSLVKLQLVLFLAFSPVLASLDAWVGLASLPINLILVPLVGLLVLPTSLLALALAAVGWLLPLNLMAEVMQLLVKVLTAASQLNNLVPFSWLNLTYLEQPAYLWLGLLVLLPAGIPLRHFAWLGWLLALQPQTSNLLTAEDWQVRVLDVGQGTSVLVSSQGQSLMHDTGKGFSPNWAAVIPAAKPWLGPKGLRYLAISHDDLDHSGGAAAVKNTWPIETEISAQQANCFAGQTWPLGALKVHALWPPQPPLAASKTRANNEDSCLLLVTSPEVNGKFASLLLTGDAGIAEEAFFSQALPSLLTNSKGQVQPLSVLITGHHGSQTSTSQTLLAATNPLWAVHTNGWRNSYGHPHKEVELRLRQAGVKQLATASQGAVVFHFSPANYPQAKVEYKNLTPPLLHFLSYKD